VRLRSRDGRWTAETITLTNTSRNQDGAWIVIKCQGIFMAQVRTPAEVEQYVPLGDLVEE